MLTGGGLTRPCLFLHLPKCGGTSLADALYAAVPAHRKLAVIDAPSTRRAAAIARFDRDDPRICHEDLPHGALTMALRESLLLAHSAAGARLIHGHVLLSERWLGHFAGRMGLVTMMREPVARTISNFRMTVRAGLIPDDLDAWMDGPVGRSHASVYLRYLSGANVVPEGAEAAHLARARAALARFDLIGFLDDLPGFRERFRELFGVSLRIPRLNAAPPGGVELDPARRARLESLCAADVVIYRAARARAALCTETGAAAPATGGALELPG